MVLSKREKYVAIAMGAAVALLGFNSLIWQPYSDNLDQMTSAIIKARDDLDTDKSLIAKQKRLQPVWQDLIRGGLHSDESQAQNTALRALDQWARFANVSFDSSRAEHSVQQGQFWTMGVNIDFTVQQKDSVLTVSRFLWDVETATIPMRINKVTISSAKEGTEILNVKVNVSTLFMPTGNQSSGQSVSMAGSNGDQL
ncbi:MAG: hypothetical protein M3O30_14370 [Planctomycetota bacterium]|nr:hypothetical protein [Planctomycetota bacterium]